MAINGCSSGLLVTAALVLLLLPAQYYVPDLYVLVEEPLRAQHQATTPPSRALFEVSFLQLPALDLFVTVTIIVLGITTYLCEWIQRKVMEKRIIKLNDYLGKSVGRLRAWEHQQQQQEATLRMVQSATTEYNLLLYLLLRQHRRLGSQRKDLAHLQFTCNECNPPL